MLNDSGFRALRCSNQPESNVYPFSFCFWHFSQTQFHSLTHYAEWASICMQQFVPTEYIPSSGSARNRKSALINTSEWNNEKDVTTTNYRFSTENGIRKDKWPETYVRRISFRPQMVSKSKTLHKWLKHNRVLTTDFM